MNCQECESLFDEMIDRRVEEPTRQRMELHLSRCAICRDKLEYRKRGHTLMFRALNGTDVRLHLPNGFADRLVAECRIQPKRSFFPALPRWALIAASLAIVAGFVFAAAVASGVFGGAEAEGEGAAETTRTTGTASTSTSDSAFPAIMAVPEVLDVLEVLAVPEPTTLSFSTNPGETTMTKTKAAAAALSAAFVAAPLAAANGDEYQFIDPTTYPAENPSHSMMSDEVALETGALRVMGDAETLEARSRTHGYSAAIALNAQKWTPGFIISVR